MEFLDSVDTWAKGLGLEIDFSTQMKSVKEVCLANTKLAVAMRGKDYSGFTLYKENVDGASVYCSKGYEGNTVGTVVSDAPVDASMDDLGVMMNHKRFVDIAPYWDGTFVDGVVLEQHGNGNPVKTASLVRWHYKAGPFKKRELLYLIVPVEQDGGVTYCYLSVRGSKYPVDGGYLRGTLLFPIFDDVKPRVNGGCAFIHCMTTTLNGFLIPCVQRMIVDPAIAKNAIKEMKKMQDVFTIKEVRDIIEEST